MKIGRFSPFDRHLLNCYYAAMFKLVDSHDLIAFIGLVMLSIGCYFVYPPLVLIVPGSILFIIGVVGALSASRISDTQKT